jgi:SAM-dependent methyltransferase
MEKNLNLKMKTKYKKENKKYYWFQKKRFEDTYFSNQLKNPKQSTIDFFKFLNSKKLSGKKILDLACGNGANLIYLKENFKNKECCVGLDINKKLIKEANKITINALDLKFYEEDILNIKNEYRNKFDGVICMQTISWLNDYKYFLKQVSKLNVNFLAVRSLFWEGLIDFKIKVEFLKNENKERALSSFNYYNIYSIENFKSNLKNIGFKNIYFKKFEISFQLKKNKNFNEMGTYTIRDKNKFIQLSGPILQNWYFVIALK